VLLQSILFCIALFYVSRVRNRRRLVETPVYGPT
jgi:hypothetical protein